MSIPIRRSKSISISNPTAVGEEDYEIEIPQKQDCFDKNNKSSMVTTETTSLQRESNESLEKSSIQIRRERVYSLNLQLQKENDKSIETNFKDNIITDIQKSMQNISQLSNDYNKDNDVVINISHIDLDKSLIKDQSMNESIIQNTETCFVNSNKRLSTERSLEIDSNIKNDNLSSINQDIREKKEEKNLIEQNEDNKLRRNLYIKLFIVFILLLLIFIGIIAFINKSNK